MNTAKFVKKIEGWRGSASLYQLSEPLKEHEFVIVSAVRAFDHGGPETFIFPANEDGEVKSFGELPGSQRGTLSHSKALKDAGYIVADAS